MFNITTSGRGVVVVVVVEVGVVVVGCSSLVGWRHRTRFLFGYYPKTPFAPCC